MVASLAAGADFNVTARKALFATHQFVFQPWRQSFGVRPGDQSFIMLQRTSGVPPAQRGAELVR